MLLGKCERVEPMYEWSVHRGGNDIEDEDRSPIAVLWNFQNFW